jgi:hypothetical protein
VNEFAGASLRVGLYSLRSPSRQVVSAMRSRSLAQRDSLEPILLISCFAPPSAEQRAVEKREKPRLSCVLLRINRILAQLESRSGRGDRASDHEQGASEPIT